MLGLVVSNLPVTNYTASSSSWDLERYKTDLIDSIASLLKGHPNTVIAIILEPGAVTSLITNTSSPNAAAIKEALTYALSVLQAPHVALYLDVGNGNQLCWDAYLLPTAKLVIELIEGKNVRGVASNTRNYNSFAASPGEFTCPDDSRGNPCPNEQTYISKLQHLVPGIEGAVMDTSRNGVLGLRERSEDWCNVNGAGFGVRPRAGSSTEVGIDAFLWVGNGGVSDGLSGDGDCAKSDAYQPSPERGKWNQGYFEILVRNAVPAL